MGLSLVPTPIGNLGDFTHRAATVLENADLILAEDTRTSGRLLQHYKIDTPLQSFHMHNEHQRVAWVIDLLKQGQQIALISDAGTPGISDPGFLLVRAAIAEGIEVECLPGATALIPALVQSGLPSDRFHFEGFLPPKKGRQSRLEYLAQNPHTTILYESPHKLLKTLEQLKEHFEHDRVVSISRELTKLYETTFRGTLSEAQQFFETNPPKGEFVLCIAGKSKK
jgi:16S rRNA (cytidine1402-2'-O)-methyltransferase